MSVPDEYITPIGSKITTKSIVNDMIRNYKDSTTKLTDFSEGTEVRNLLESISLSSFKLDYYCNVNFRQAYLVYATGGYLDLYGIDRNLPRKQGSQANGFVTITLTEPLLYDYEIKPQTSFYNPSTNVKYSIYISMHHDINLTIPAGETSITIPIVCTQYGKIGNTERNTITGFNEEPKVPMTVTNSEPVQDGTDPENDYDYRTRLLAKSSGGNFGSKDWYKGLLKQIDGVHDVAIDFKEQMVRVFVNGYSKPVSQNILVTCLSILNEDENHLLGHNFNVLSPDYNRLNLRVTITSTENVTEAQVRERVTAYFDSGEVDGVYYQGLNLGETITENGLIGCVNSISGITSAVFELQDNTGAYTRFSSIVNQSFEVGYLNNLEIVFR